MQHCAGLVKPSRGPGKYGALSTYSKSMMCFLHIAKMRWHEMCLHCPQDILKRNSLTTKTTEYLKISTCCTEWMENDEHCMQQLVLWLHQTQSWLNVHVSIPEFWGLKSPLLQGMYQSRNLQRCPMWEVQSPLRVGTVAGSPRHHKTSRFQTWCSGRCLYRSYCPLPLRIFSKRQLE